MTTSVAAKVLDGHAFATTQPLAGFGDTQLTSFVYFTASQHYPMSIQRTTELTFFENATNYLFFVLNENAPLGQVICVPNPLTTPRCEIVC